MVGSLSSQRHSPRRTKGDSGNVENVENEDLFDGILRGFTLLGCLSDVPLP